MIKNIIFDIGDVLVKSRWHEFFWDKGYDEKTAQRLEKATFFSPAWKELDRGILTFDQVIEEFVKNDPEIEIQIRNSVKNLCGFISVYSYAESWIKSFKQAESKVFCLSNISDKICVDCASELEFLRLTDGYVLSYREKLIKPDPEIFRIILERYKLIAEECIFIDDSEENIISANNLGINGIVFQNKNQADNEIRRIIYG